MVRTQESHESSKWSPPASATWVLNQVGGWPGMNPKLELLVTRRGWDHTHSGSTEAIPVSHPKTQGAALP